MDTIFLKGIVLHAHHGVLAEEQRLGQRFILHLEMDLDLSRAGSSDRLEDSVNYASVYELAASIATQQRFNLLEALAEAIASGLLANFPPLQAVRITIEKPSAPIAGVLECAGVTLRRSRA